MDFFEFKCHFLNGRSIIIILQEIKVYLIIVFKVIFNFIKTKDQKKIIWVIYFNMCIKNYLKINKIIETRKQK